MPAIHDITAGTLLAKRVAASRLSGDQVGALKMLGSANREELAIAANYLAGRLREALLHVTDGEEDLAFRLLLHPYELDGR